MNPLIAFIRENPEFVQDIVRLVEKMDFDYGDDQVKLYEFLSLLRNEAL